MQIRIPFLFFHTPRGKNGGKCSRRKKACRAGRRSVRRRSDTRAAASAVLAILSALLLPASALLSGCRRTLSSPITEQAFALDTIISISAYETLDNDYSGQKTRAAVREAISDCEAYEDIFSMQKEGSALWKLNAGQTDTVPWQLADCLQTALDYSSLSGGAFEVSIGKVSRLWDFTSDSPAVPDDSDIQAALAFVDDTRISVSPKDPSDPQADRTVTMPEGYVLDLGAAAKGYIADRMKEDLQEKGIRRAVINLGGNVLVFGGKSGGTEGDGSISGAEPFAIGIRRPFAQSDEYLATVRAADLSIVSSGNYERQFTDENGNFYYHILDPATGYPCQSGLSQVTILTSSSADADALSTVCFCLGRDAGLALIESVPATEAVFVSTDGTITESSGAGAIVNLTQ